MTTWYIWSVSSQSMSSWMAGSCPIYPCRAPSTRHTWAFSTRILNVPNGHSDLGFYLMPGTWPLCRWWPTPVCSPSGKPFCVLPGTCYLPALILSLLLLQICTEQKRGQSAWLSPCLHSGRAHAVRCHVSSVLLRLMLRYFSAMWISNLENKACT